MKISPTFHAPSISMAGGQCVNKAVHCSQHKGWFDMKWELSWLAPRLSTLGLCNVTACDQISQAFPSIFGYCKQSKTGGGNGLGTRLIGCCQFYCMPTIAPVLLHIWSLTCVYLVSFTACQPLHQFCCTSGR